MRLPNLQSCCVCDLKTGNIVLGGVNALFSFVLLVVMLAVTMALSFEVNSSSYEVGANEQVALANMLATSILLVFMLIVKFWFDIVFVYGAIHERVAIIKAYFIMWIVFFLMSMTTLFINIIYYPWITVCTELLYIGLNLYAFLLSHSFYKQLNERDLK